MKKMIMAAIAMLMAGVGLATAGFIGLPGDCICHFDLLASLW